VRSPPTPANMNLAGVVVPGTANAVVSLNTCPVGGPPGTATTSGVAATGAPPTAPLYRVAVPVPALDTQTGVFGPRDMPQALTRWASVSGAFPGWSETRFVWVNAVVRPCASAVSGTATASADEASSAAPIMPARFSMVLPSGCGDCSPRTCPASAGGRGQ